MAQKVLIAIGAGLAAAILFIVPVKGTLAAGMVAFFASLPIMIAGLAFSPATALIAVVAGAFAAALALHPYLAFVFALWAGLPAWWLTRLAWLGRPPEAGESPQGDGLVWYPVDRLLMWAAIIATGVMFCLVFVGIIRFGGYTAFIEQLTKSVTTMLETMLKTPGGPKPPQGMSTEAVAGMLVRNLLPQLAAWGVLMFSFNLWLAGRIALTSDRLRRGWQPLPENLRLPQAMAIALGAALAIGLVSGLPRMLGIVAASAIGMAFAIQGFAVIHALTRGSRTRGLNLSIIYVLNFVLMPIPLLFTALLGVADTFFDLRRFRSPPGANPPANPPPPANSNGPFGGDSR